MIGNVFIFLIKICTNSCLNIRNGKINFIFLFSYSFSVFFFFLLYFVFHVINLALFPNVHFFYNYKLHFFSSIFLLYFVRMDGKKIIEKKNKKIIKMFEWQQFRFFMFSTMLFAIIKNFNKSIKSIAIFFVLSYLWSSVGTLIHTSHLHWIEKILKID